MGAKALMLSHCGAGKDSWESFGLQGDQSSQKERNLGYVDDTPLMTEREEELKSLLMSMKKESEKAVLKLNIQ